MFRDAQHEPVLDDPYHSPADPISDERRRELRARRIHREMSSYYPTWRARMHQAMKNSPVHAPASSSR